MLKNKNFITPAGLIALQEELENLLKVERPEVVAVVTWAASNGDRSENADYKYGKKRLREIDRRAQFLAKQIDRSEVIDPIKISSDKVEFGATVEFLTEEGETRIYSIIGVDEVDVSRGKISWRSPLGAALIGGKQGDFISYQSPKGEVSVEIIKISYQEVN